MNIAAVRMLVAASIFTIAQSVAAQETFTIYWNNNHVYEAYQEVIDEFAADHGVEVDLQTFAWPDMRTKLLTDFSAQQGPDLLEVPATWITEFAGLGALQDVTSEIAMWDESSDWFEGTWAEVTLDEKRYGLKLHHTALALFYNKDLFEQAGLDPEDPPETMSEFYATAEALAEALGPDVLSFGFDTDPGYVMPFFASEETPFLIEDGEIAIDTPTIRETLQTLQDISSAGWALRPEPGAAYQATRRSFFEQRVAKILSGPWDIANLESLESDFNYGISPVPRVDGSGALSTVAGTAIAIPSDAAHPELAWDLMQRLTAVDVEVAATLETGMMMPRASWAEDPRLEGVPGVAEFTPILGAATPFDIAARNLGLGDITPGGDVFEQLYQTVVYARGDVDEALETYVNESNRMIERASE